jgi:DUF3037 family protein
VPEPSLFDYAVVRVVPDLERGEFLNAGVIVFCRTLRFLAARVELDLERLAALAPCADPDEIHEHLESIPRLCEGGPQAGPLGLLSQSERFHWLVAPRSTVIQTSPVHPGLCTDPAAMLEHLMDTLVRSGSATARPQCQEKPP